MDEKDQLDCDSYRIYRNVEHMVADITDRALLNGQLQRKNAVEQNYETVIRLKDRLDYSFSNPASNNFALGTSFKKLGIGTYDNAERIQNIDKEQNYLDFDDHIVTPKLSSGKLVFEILISVIYHEISYVLIVYYHIWIYLVQFIEDIYVLNILIQIFLLVYNDIIILQDEDSQNSDNNDEMNEDERSKNNPFYGMQRQSIESSLTKSPFSKQYKTDFEMNQNGGIEKLKTRTKNYLNIFYFIIKFKYLLKKFTSIQNMFTLTEHQLDMINDKSFGNIMVKKKKKISFKNKMLSQLKQIWISYTSIPVLDPSNYVVSFQEILSFIVIMAQLFYQPVKTSYPMTSPNSYLFLFLETLPPYYFFSEMIFNINKGFYQEGIAVVDRISVFKHYMKSDFLIDLITTGVLYSTGAQSFYSLIFLIRIPQLYNIIEKVDENFQLGQKFPIAFQLIKLLYQIILVAHLCGCGFHYVGMHSDSSSNWIKNKNLDNESFVERYVCSVYFAIIAMVTVGFGDVVPINMYERIYVILQTCFSCGIFAFAINTIGNIVKEKQQQSHELKVNKNSVLSYMKDRNISKQNQYKVIRYLEYSHKNQNDIPSKGKEIIQSMSKSVRDGIYSEFYNRVINQMPLFSNRFSQKFRQEIQQHLNETVYGPGDCIITQGKLSKNVFFIVTGEVTQMIKMKESSLQQSVLLQVLKQGDSFDEECFVSNLPCKYEYICRTVTQVAFIEKSIFEEVIQAFQQDYEIYCMLLHEIRLQQDKTTLQNKICFSCKGKTHSAINCPFLHYEVDHEFFLKRLISNQVSYQKKLFLLLRLPKTYEMDNQININEQNYPISPEDLNKFLEYDDALFIACSPKIVYSKTQQEIVFINEEDECDYMQETEDEIEHSNEDQSSNHQNTTTSKLLERNEGIRNRTDKKKTTLIQKLQMEEQIYNNQHEYTLDSQVYNESQVQNNKYDNKAFIFENSSEFSSHHSKSPKSNKNTKQFNPDEVLSSMLRKSRSMTILKDDDDDFKNQIDDEQEEMQYQSQKILKESIQSNQNNSGKKKKRTLVIEKNSLNLVNSDAQGIINNHKNNKESQMFDEDFNFNVKNSSNYVFNNNVNNYTFTSAANVEDSFINYQQNQFINVQGDNDEQPQTKQIFGVQSNSEKIIQNPVSQIASKKIEAELGIGRGQNRLDQEIKPKVKTKNAVNQNQVSNYQQNTNQQKAQSQFQNQNQNLSDQSIKSPVLQIQSTPGQQQQQTKKNQNLQNPSSLNIQQQGQFPTLVNNNSMPARASRISIHLNEPNVNANQNLSINNLSHTQIKEHSSYSRRTINSNISAIKSPPPVVQQAPAINPNQQYQSQNSQPQQNSSQNAPTNRQFTIGQQILNRQGSTFTLTNPSLQRKQQTLRGGRQSTLTGTLILAQKQELQKQNLIDILQKQNYQSDGNSIQQTKHEQTLMILDFDLMKSFQNFFPHNNYDKQKSMISSQKKSGKGVRRQKKRKSFNQAKRKKLNESPSKRNDLDLKSKLQDVKRISVNYLSQQRIMIKSKQQIPSNFSIQQVQQTS